MVELDASEELDIGDRCNRDVLGATVCSTWVELYKFLMYNSIAGQKAQSERFRTRNAAHWNACWGPTGIIAVTRELGLAPVQPTVHQELVGKNLLLANCTSEARRMATMHVMATTKWAKVTALRIDGI